MTNMFGQITARAFNTRCMNLTLAAVALGFGLLLPSSAALAALTATVIPTSGPFGGGNRVVITNATGNIGGGANITNITVGGVVATGFATSQGTTWVSFIAPATSAAGLKDIVIQSTTIGTTTLTGKYTVNPAGEIGTATKDWTRWDEVASLPVQYGRYNHAAAVLNNALYVIGGDAPGGAKTNVYCYNGTNWTEVAGLPATRDSSAAAVLNGSLYLCGGNKTNVFRYDGTNWTQVVGLPAARQILGAATLNGALYAMGGYSGLATTYKYDGTSWTTGTALPSGRDSLTATTLGSALYVVGGENSSGVLQTNVYQYNGTSWASVAGLPVATMSHAADVLNNALYVVGGVTNGPTYEDTKNVYKYDGTSWTTATSLPVTRHYHTVSTLNGSLYSVGGISGGGGGATTNVFRYPAVVAGVSAAPSSGSYAGGYQVTINGVNLGSGADITNVTLCGFSASIQTQSATQIVVTAGAASAVTLGDVCVYSTSFGATLKANAFTYTYPPPSITVQPVGAVVAVGQSAGVSVTASGNAPLGYQWLKNGAILTGQTNATLTYSSFQFTNSGSYAVVVSNLGGLAISLPASLSVPSALLKGWGYNGSGQLRNANQSQTLPITLASNVVNMAAGDGHSLFVTTDGTLWGMGNNSYAPGELGLGTAVNSTTVPLVVTNNVVAATAGTGASFFIKTDGTLWGMGYNNYGTLGNGTFVTPADKLPVFVTNNVVAVSVGQYNSFFVKSDGTLWAMGMNDSGQLGIGTTANTNLPTYVANNVVAVAAGLGHTLFMKADGSAWGVGGNSQGQLGLGNNTSPQNSPAYITNNVVSIGVGGSHSMFVKADGTLWNTGYNADGEFGNGTLIATNQLSYLTNNVVAAIGGNRHSLFMKANGSLWTMGWNYYGTLGNGTSGNIKYTNVVAVSGGLVAASLANNSGCLNYHCLAIAGVSPVAGALTNQTAAVGHSTSFTALVASGDGPYTYQWQKTGTNILDATNAVYTLTSAALTDAGNYAVLVSSTYGTTSTNAVLTVEERWTTTHPTPESWLEKYGFTGDFEQHSLEDTDRDGMANWQEYVAGTDPTNALSGLVMSSPVPVLGTNYTDVIHGTKTQRVYEVIGHSMIWPGVVGRVYNVEYSTNLFNWLNLEGATDLPGLSPDNTVTDMPPARVKFYRVKVRLP